MSRAVNDARRTVVEAIDHGTVAVHQNGPTVSILLVRLHPDTEQQQHAPVPAAVQGRVKFGAGPLKKRGRRHEENKVRPHLLVVAPERPAVDKLLAIKVISIPVFSLRYDKVIPAFEIAPIRPSDPTLSSRSDLRYVPTLRTFLLYERSYSNFFYSEVRGAEAPV